MANTQQNRNDYCRSYQSDPPGTTIHFILN